MIENSNRCASCRFCVDKRMTDGYGIGLCVEPHMPKNASGESKSTVFLLRKGCSKYQPMRKPSGRPKKQKSPVETLEK